MGSTLLDRRRRGLDNSLRGDANARLGGLTHLRGLGLFRGGRIRQGIKIAVFPVGRTRRSGLQCLALRDRFGLGFDRNKITGRVVSRRKLGDLERGFAPRAFARLSNVFRLNTDLGPARGAFDLMIHESSSTKADGWAILRERGY